MCGIAGVLYADPRRPVDRLVLKAMGDAIAHRGPDGEGYWSEPGVGLAHRRLSIIDVDGGNQPIGNEDGSVQIVFNGEIYNFRELRARLEAKGHRFRTHSDTEVIVHLYEDEGPRLVERLRGMFAFGLWDARRKRLLLARDRIGMKPLYVYRDAAKLVFGSELKALLAHPEVTRQIDVTALEDFLAFGMVAGHRSIFQQVDKLPAAHVLVVESADLHARPQRYWQVQFQPDHRPTVGEWREAIRAKIDESVACHLIADVPVGAFLSGGIDSSVVVASIAQAAAQPLQTFSIGFREEAFSELPYARQVASRYHTQHVEAIATPDAVDLVATLVHHYDEPFGDSSAIPMFLVSQLASRTVKVVLSGDGGDEAFGGYTRYVHDLREAAVRERLPRWFQQTALAPLADMWPRADWLPRPLRAKTLLTNLSLDGPAAYANSLSLCRPPLLRRLIAPDLATRLNGTEPGAGIRDSYRTAPSGDPLAGMIAADIGVRVPDDYLVKVDRASMACGLEVRPPFLDHELIELTARIPSNLKIRSGETKWILKETFRDQLPGEILTRPKRGFEIPVDAWLRGPLREVFESTALEPRSHVAGLINQDTVRGMYRAHLARTSRHGSVLWSVMILAQWAERYLGTRARG